jgi:glucans biosynthesis protein C
MELKSPVRNNTLDWLRVIGILFVFLYHTTRFYNVEDWLVKNSYWYPSVEVWNGLATSFMMPLMFVISGASLFYAMGRGGFGRFLKDKILRLLVPFVVGTLTHVGLQVYLGARWHNQFSGSFFQFLPRYFTPGAFAFEGQHLWFLLVLFIFCVILYPLLRWLKGGGRGFLANLARVMARTWVLYIMALPILVLYVLIGPDSPLMRGAGGYPVLLYAWFLLLGFFMVSDEALQEKIRGLRWESLALGLVLITGFSVAYNLVPDRETISVGLAAAVVMRVFGGWICVLAIYGFGLRYLTARTARLDYANEAVMPFYVLHQTVLIAVGFFLIDLRIPDGLEWALITVISFAIILAVYEFLIRRWNVMRVLFGMKRLPQQSAGAAVKPPVGVSAR